jgi:hypothetical protein
VRHEREEILRAFLAQQVADAPAHQQGRDTDRACRDLEAGGIDERRARFVRAAEPAADERRSQCRYQRPSSLPQFFLRPSRLLDAAVRVAALDRVGDLVERRSRSCPP